MDDARELLFNVIAGLMIRLKQEYIILSKDEIENIKNMGLLFDKSSIVLDQLTSGEIIIKIEKKDR